MAKSPQETEKNDINLKSKKYIEYLSLPSRLDVTMALYVVVLLAEKSSVSTVCKMLFDIIMSGAHIFHLYFMNWKAANKSSFIYETILKGLSFWSQKTNSLYIIVNTCQIVCKKFQILENYLGCP